MIGPMPSTRTWHALAPLDGVSLTLRWLMLAAVPTVAGLSGRMGWGLALLLLVWAGLSLGITAAWAAGWRPRLLGGVLAACDLALALTALALSGGLGSPLWWTLLIGSIGAGLAYGMVVSLAVASVGALAAAALTFSMYPGGPEVLLPLALNGAPFLLAAGLTAWLAEQVRETARGGPAGAGPPAAAVDESERMRTVFRMASELNATLNYERVLEMALDLSSSAVAESGADDERMVSALLLFAEDTLHVASARGLTHADLRVSLPARRGLLARALASGEPALTQAPTADPELPRLAALHACEAVVCIPLAAGLEAYGALLFGHTRKDFFTPARMELLQAIGHQAMVALQNASLYRDLEQEKERITEIQEEARKKLARDLHDGPTQSIAAIAMRVNFARRLMERDPRGASEELFKVEDLARRTTKEIRHMLFTLRPLILESQGLVAALQQLGEKTRETHAQNVLVEAAPGAVEGLEIGKQGVVFYIAEEAINNARKHAEARHIWVRLRRRDDLFFLEIQDDGVGFNLGAVDANYEQRGSLGMVNMRERAELVSGLLHVESAEGAGTRVLVAVPLTEASAERLHRSGIPV